MALYCRVSTGDQDNDRQERDLRAYAERAGYEVVTVFWETLSGIRKAKGKRPVERKRAMTQAREVAAVMVTELTGWGRSTQDLMASLAEFEHDLLREKVRSGIAAAKARGQTLGRKKGHRPSDDYAPEVIRLSEDEKLSQREIAGRLGISKTTVNKILKRRTRRPPDPGSSGP